MCITRCGSATHYTRVQTLGINNIAQAGPYAVKTVFEISLASALVSRFKLFTYDQHVALLLLLLFAVGRFSRLQLMSRRTTQTFKHSLDRLALCESESESTELYARKIPDSLQF